jgi:hypothetical protein
VTVPINSDITSFPLTGLTNGHTYFITVSAVIQAIYYLAVTAHDTSGQSGGDPGRSHESAYSTERHFNIGPPTEGPPSNEVLGTPDELVPAPYLPNTGCFIASAAYGSHDAPPVRVLRDFRDRVLAATSSGRAFIAWYYRTSPRLAEQLNGHPGLKPLVRIALEPVVAAAFLVTETRPAICVALLLSLAAAAYLARRRRRTADITRS